MGRCFLHQVRRSQETKLPSGVTFDGSHGYTVTPERFDAGAPRLPQKP